MDPAAIAIGSITRIPRLRSNDRCLISHKRRRFSKRRHVRARELIRRFAIADPTRRATTIFRPTSFRKANTDRVHRLSFQTFPRCERAPVYLHPARQTQRLPAEIGAALDCSVRCPQRMGESLAADSLRRGAPPAGTRRTLQRHENGCMRNASGRCVSSRTGVPIRSPPRRAVKRASVSES